MAQPPLSRIFVSSTYHDMLAYCHAVIEALTACWMIPQILPPPTTSAALEYRLETIKNSDYFLVLAAHCYGWQPPGDSRSFLEIEYDAAEHQPRHSFVIDPDYPWSPSHVDSGPVYNRLMLFKRTKLAQNPNYQTFTNPLSLELAIIGAYLPIHGSTQSNIFQLAEYLICGVSDPLPLNANEMKLTLLLNHPANLVFLRQLSQYLGIHHSAVRLMQMRQNLVQLALPTDAAIEFSHRFYDPPEQGVAATARNESMTPDRDFLSDQLHDLEWLEDHIHEAHERIVSELAEDHTVHIGIENLLIVMPFISTHPELLRWELVLIDAMGHAQTLNDPDSQIQLWTYLGICFLRKGNHKSATQAFNDCLDTIDQWVTPQIELIARIGILHGQSIFHAYDIDEFIRETISLARQVNDLKLLARLHFTLGIAYTHRARTQLALGHAQTSFAYWSKLDYSVEQDRALLLMAEACRAAGLLQLSKFYLSRSLSRYTNLFQSAIANYHDGAIAFQEANYQVAQTSLEKALTEFEEVGDYPYLTGAAHHALGLTYTRVNAFTEAGRSLRAAMAIWLRLENIFEEANALYAIGFLHQRQEHFSSAREYYLHALDRLTTLPPSPIIDDLRQNIDENLNQLP